MNAKFVILGIGNLLRSDDGVGVHAAQALARNPPPGADVVDAGTDALSALPFFEQAERMLIIDAVHSGAAPGTVTLWAERDLAPLPERATVHALNLLAARHLLPPGAPWPEVTVLGVEPAVLDYGLTLSPPVAAALPHVERRCHDIVHAWLIDQETHQPGRSA
jgi:hydrogenase maturation protease